MVLHIRKDEIVRMPIRRPKPREQFASTAARRKIGNDWHMTLFFFQSRTFFGLKWRPDQRDSRRRRAPCLFSGSKYATVGLFVRQRFNWSKACWWCFAHYHLTPRRVGSRSGAVVVEKSGIKRDT